MQENTISTIVSWIASFINSPVFLALVITAVALVLAWLVYRISLKVRKFAIERIIYTRFFSEEGVHAGDTLTLTEVIYNPTLIPLFFIDVGSYVSTGIAIDGATAEQDEKIQYFVSRFTLMPFTKITRTHDVKCNTRNYYKLDTAEIYTNKQFVYISAPAELYVYPRALNNKNSVVAQLNYLGNELTRSRYIKDPFMIAGLRNYMPGDPINSINFKASARSIRNGVRELVVNNYDFSSQLNIAVYMDFEAPQFLKIKTPEYVSMIEAGLSYAAAIICEAAGQGGKAGFAANTKGKNGALSVYFPPAAGSVQAKEILKCMAGLDYVSGMSFTALFDRSINQEQYDTDICIINFYTDPELESRIRQLKRLGRGVTVITLERN
jgi:uncharacterized protein (DUF58 family)